MRIRLWRAFASNNSGSYTIVGRFPTPGRAAAFVRSLEDLRERAKGDLGAFARTIHEGGYELVDDAWERGWGAEAMTAEELLESWPDLLLQVGTTVIVDSGMTLRLSTPIPQMLYAAGGRLSVHHSYYALHQTCALFAFELSLGDWDAALVRALERSGVRWAALDERVYGTCQFHDIEPIQRAVATCGGALSADVIELGSPKALPLSEAIRRALEAPPRDRKRYPELLRARGVSDAAGWARELTALDRRVADWRAAGCPEPAPARTWFFEREAWRGTERRWRRGLRWPTQLKAAAAGGSLFVETEGGSLTAALAHVMGTNWTNAVTAIEGPFWLTFKIRALGDETTGVDAAWRALSRGALTRLAAPKSKPELERPAPERVEGAFQPRSVTDAVAAIDAATRGPDGQDLELHCEVSVSALYPQLSALRRLRSELDRGRSPTAAD